MSSYKKCGLFRFEDVMQVAVPSKTMSTVFNLTHIRVNSELCPPPMERPWGLTMTGDNPVTNWSVSRIQKCERGFLGSDSSCFLPFVKPSCKLLGDTVESEETCRRLYEDFLLPLT